ncbi:hypothetical protein EDD11_003665 [Mortierella claussenii]|nr:hypothetical protein EDD11_003665 [Mortierella claussenii]
MSAINDDSIKDISVNDSHDVLAPVLVVDSGLSSEPASTPAPVTVPKALPFQILSPKQIRSIDWSMYATHERYHTLDYDPHQVHYVLEMYKREFLRGVEHLPPHFQTIIHKRYEDLQALPALDPDHLLPGQALESFHGPDIAKWKQRTKKLTDAQTALDAHARLYLNDLLRLESVERQLINETRTYQEAHSRLSFVSQVLKNMVENCTVADFMIPGTVIWLQGMHPRRAKLCTFIGLTYEALSEIRILEQSKPILVRHRRALEMEFPLVEEEKYSDKAATLSSMLNGLCARYDGFHGHTGQENATHILSMVRDASSIITDYSMDHAFKGTYGDFLEDIEDSHLAHDVVHLRHHLARTRCSKAVGSSRTKASGNETMLNMRLKLYRIAQDVMNHGQSIRHLLQIETPVALKMIDHPSVCRVQKLLMDYKTMAWRGFLAGDDVGRSFTLNNRVPLTLAYPMQVYSTQASQPQNENPDNNATVLGEHYEDGDHWNDPAADAMSVTDSSDASAEVDDNDEDVSEMDSDSGDDQGEVHAMVVAEIERNKHIIRRGRRVLARNLATLEKCGGMADEDPLSNYQHNLDDLHLFPLNARAIMDAFTAEQISQFDHQPPQQQLLLLPDFSTPLLIPVQAPPTTLVLLKLSRWSVSRSDFQTLLERSPHLVLLELKKCVVHRDQSVDGPIFKHAGLRHLAISMDTLFTRQRHSDFLNMLHPSHLPCDSDDSEQDINDDNESPDLTVSNDSNITVPITSAGPSAIITEHSSILSGAGSPGGTTSTTISMISSDSSDDGLYYINTHRPSGPRDVSQSHLHELHHNLEQSLFEHFPNLEHWKVLHTKPPAEDYIPWIGAQIRAHCSRLNKLTLDKFSGLGKLHAALLVRVMRPAESLLPEFRDSAAVDSDASQAAFASTAMGPIDGVDPENQMPAAIDRGGYLLGNGCGLKLFRADYDSTFGTPLIHALRLHANTLEVLEFDETDRHWRLDRTEGYNETPPPHESGDQDDDFEMPHAANFALVNGPGHGLGYGEFHPLNIGQPPAPPAIHLQPVENSPPLPPFNLPAPAWHHRPQGGLPSPLPTPPPFLDNDFNDDDDDHGDNDGDDDDNDEEEEEDVNQIGDEGSETDEDGLENDPQHAIDRNMHRILLPHLKRLRHLKLPSAILNIEAIHGTPLYSWLSAGTLEECWIHINNLQDHLIPLVMHALEAVRVLTYYKHADPCDSEEGIVFVPGPQELDQDVQESQQGGLLLQHYVPWTALQQYLDRFLGKTLGESDPELAYRELSSLPIEHVHFGDLNPVQQNLVSRTIRFLRQFSRLRYVWVGNGLYKLKPPHVPDAALQDTATGFPATDEGGGPSDTQDMEADIEQESATLRGEAAQGGGEASESGSSLSFSRENKGNHGSWGTSDKVQLTCRSVSSDLIATIHQEEGGQNSGTSESNRPSRERQEYLRQMQEYEGQEQVHQRLVEQEQERQQRRRAENAAGEASCVLNLSVQQHELNRDGSCGGSNGGSSGDMEMQQPNSDLGEEADTETAANRKRKRSGHDKLSDSQLVECINEEATEELSSEEEEDEEDEVWRQSDAAHPKKKKSCVDNRL